MSEVQRPKVIYEKPDSRERVPSSTKKEKPRDLQCPRCKGWFSTYEHWDVCRVPRLD